MIIIILKLAGLCILGMLVEIFFNRVPKLRERCLALKEPFSLSIYFKEDWLSFIQQGIVMAIFLSFSAIVMRLFEIQIEYMYIASSVGGAYGTNILNKRYSAFGKRLLDIIDKNAGISKIQLENFNNNNDNMENLTKDEIKSVNGGVETTEIGGDRPNPPINPIIPFPINPNTTVKK